MKYPHSLAILAFAALTTGLTTTSAQTTTMQKPAGRPIVMTPPAPPDGSNWSRAPLPAQRRFDDMKGPDGKAIDDLPPNTQATNIEPPVPPARVAIFQPTPAPGITAEPGLMPTGRTVPTPPPAPPPAQPQYNK
jgi:hypothetical protein